MNLWMTVQPRVFLASESSATHWSSSLKVKSSLVFVLLATYYNKTRQSLCSNALPNIFLIWISCWMSRFCPHPQIRSMDSKVSCDSGDWRARSLSVLLQVRKVNEVFWDKVLSGSPRTLMNYDLTGEQGQRDGGNLLIMQLSRIELQDWSHQSHHYANRLFISTLLFISLSERNGTSYF